MLPLFRAVVKFCSINRPFTYFVLLLIAEEAVRKNAMMITTEISQVPLSGVIALLRLAK